MRLCMTPVILTEPLCIVGCFSTRNVTNDEIPESQPGPSVSYEETVQPLCVPMIPVMRPRFVILLFEFSGITLCFTLPSNPESDFLINNRCNHIKKEIYPKFFVLKIFNTFF